MSGSEGVMMMMAKLVGLPLLGGVTAAGLAAQSLDADVAALGHDILYVGVGVIVALLILAVVIAVAAGKIRQQVTSHERRLWVIEDKGSPALQKLTALLEHENASILEILRRQEEQGHDMARIAARLVRVETLLHVRTNADTSPITGLGG